MFVPRVGNMVIEFALGRLPQETELGVLERVAKALEQTHANVVRKLDATFERESTFHNCSDVAEEDRLRYMI